MRNIFRLFLSLVTVIVLFGCSDRLDDYYTAEDLAGLKVHLQLPDYSRALVKTRALDADENISSVTVIAYDRDGKFISQPPVTMTSNTITPSLPSGTATVAVVTNTKLSDDQCKNLSSTFLTTTPSATNPVCWGSASVNDLLKFSDPKISLLRMTAKATVQSSTNDFTVEGIKVYHTAGAGSIAPATTSLTNGAVTTVTNKPGENFSATYGDYKSASQVFYETPKGKAFLIVKGKYKDKEGKDNVGYYKVQMYKDAEKSNEELDLLRNHNYIVTINSVNEAGYSSEDEAVDGDAENRMKVNIVDDNPEIVDMISCKDYELGVCAPLTTDDGKGGNINATVVTSYQKSKSSNTYDYSIAPDVPDWVTVGTATKTVLPNAAGPDGEKSSNGALCVIPLTLTQNPTEKERTAKLTVTAGDLTRTITIKQAGYDFLVDDKRKVTFLINGTPQSDNYFGKFLPAVNGVKAADNQGLVRDHGLHFAAVKGNTYSYKIPHLTGDKLENKDNSHISISDGGEGDYYTVTLANSEDDALWVSEFTIKNASGTEITYPVYHTGIFHQIKDAIANNWELGEKKKTGWFYYGIVEVKGTSGSIYHLLDRNIGATTNAFYSPSTQALKDNDGAKGAYMILTKDAQKTSWYVYNAPDGVSSINFILKKSGGSDGDKLTTKDQSASSNVYYEVSGSSASKTSNGPEYKDESSNFGVYVKSSSIVPHIYVWYYKGDTKQEPNGSYADAKPMSVPEYTPVGNEFLPDSYFRIPTESYVKDIKLEIEKRSTDTGEAYNCYFIKTTGGRGSDVQPEEVYIPVTGYYEGTSFRNENHANIWTSTRLSGFQGFSVSSPEFGFWFRYLDCHTTIEEISNMRIVGGSAGNYGGYIYTGMPVRGIHRIHKK